LFIGVRNVLFWIEQAPEGGLGAELCIDWPVVTDGRTPLQLHQVIGPRGMREHRPTAIFGHHDPQ
jgi:hypothetical protein